MVRRCRVSSGPSCGPGCCAYDRPTHQRDFSAISNRKLLRINVLGGAAVLRDGKPFVGAAAQPRRLAVLALLARARERGLTREKLIAYLWPDADEERGRRVLSQTLYSIRRDLGSEDVI